MLRDKHERRFWSWGEKEIRAVGEVLEERRVTPMGRNGNAGRDATPRGLKEEVAGNKEKYGSHRFQGV